MCCGTHDLRDALSGMLEGKLPVFAERPEFQCQCMFGRQCKRRATDEDFRCDWCREIEGNRRPVSTYAVGDWPGHYTWMMNHTTDGGYISEPMFTANLPRFDLKPLVSDFKFMFDYNRPGPLP